MMTIMKIKLLGILCIMLYEYLILIRYSLKIDTNWGQIFDFIKYIFCMCIFERRGKDMWPIALKDKILYGDAIRKRFNYTYRTRLFLKHKWEPFYNLHRYLIGFVSLFYCFTDTYWIRMVHKLNWNMMYRLYGVH